MSSTGDVIVRHKVDRNFTILPNDLLQNDGLSWKALGILAYILSLPSDFRLRLSHLAKRHSSGRDATRSGLKELERAGYLRIRWERSLGKFAQCIWEVSSRADAFTPCSDFPDTEDPIPDRPDPGKPTLQRTTSKKEPISKRTTTGRVAPLRTELAEQLDDATRLAVAKLLVDVPEADAASLVNELVQAMQSPGLIRTTPVRWFGGLVGRYREGQFSPTATKKLRSIKASSAMRKVASGPEVAEAGWAEIRAALSGAGK